MSYGLGRLLFRDRLGELVFLYYLSSARYFLDPKLFVTRSVYPHPAPRCNRDPLPFSFSNHTGELGGYVNDGKIRKAFIYIRSKPSDAWIPLWIHHPYRRMPGFRYGSIVQRTNHTKDRKKGNRKSNCTTNPF